MALTALEALALSRGYTDKTVIGGGAIKGKNCTIEQVEPITDGNRIHFLWTLDDGTEQRTYIDVMDGEQGVPGQPGDTGLGIKSVKIKTISGKDHLIITYDDDTTEDAGVISGGGAGVLH